MIAKLKSPRTRPYWHVDLKWVFGILLLFSLGACLLLFNLAKLTERDRAVEISGTIVAGFFSKNGLDDETEVAAFRQMAAASPEETIAPIPQFPMLTITKEQAMTLSPRELRVAIFSNLTRVIYDEGVAGAAEKLTPDAAEQAQFTNQASLLSVFTKATHDVLQRGFVITLVLSVAFLIGVVYFSAGWGRLVSPGLILLATSQLGTVVGLALLYPPPDGDSPFAALPGGVVAEIGAAFSQSYAIATVVGIILLVTALVGKVIQKMLRSRKPTST